MQDQVVPPSIHPERQAGGQNSHETVVPQEDAPVSPVSFASSWSPWSPLRNRAWSGRHVSARQAQDAGEQSGADRTSGESCEDRSR